MARTFFACLLSFLAAAQLLAGPGDDDLRDLIERRRVVVAMLSCDLPPFVSTAQGGRVAGFDVRLAEGVASELGVELKIERCAKTFNEVVDAVASGKADIGISELSLTLNRSKRVLFTDPYLVLKKALLVNRLELAKSKAGRDVADYIRSYSGALGVIEGSSYVDFARKMFPKASLKSCPSWEAALKAVDSGELPCAFYDDLEIKRGMKSIPDATLRLQCVVFKDSEDPIAMAVSPDRPHLLHWLNCYIKERKVQSMSGELLALDQEPSAPRKSSKETEAASGKPK